MSSPPPDALAALLALPGTRARLDLADWTRTVSCWPPRSGDAAEVDLRVEVVAASGRWLLLRSLDAAVVQRRPGTRAETGRARIRPAAGSDWGTPTGRLPLLRLLDLSESGLRVLVRNDPPSLGVSVDVQLVLGHDQELSDLVVVRGTVRRHDPCPDGVVVAVHLDERLPGRSPDRIRAAVLRAQGAARRERS